MSKILSILALLVATCGLVIVPQVNAQVPNPFCPPRFKPPIEIYPHYTTSEWKINRTIINNKPNLIIICTH